MSAIPQEFMGDLVEGKIRVGIDAARGATVLKTEVGDILLGPEQTTKLVLALLECGFTLSELESDD